MQERLNALVLDTDACLESLKQVADHAQLTLTPAASAEELLKSVVMYEPDLVLLDAELPGASGWDLTKRLREASPATPILLLSANPDWAALPNDPMIEMVRSPIDPNELLRRISRLIHGVSLLKDGVQRYRLPILVVDELRADSGRIDAKKITEMFDISVPTLAKIIGAGEQALYKTPDAKSIQPKLADFERIAWGLLKLTGSVKGLRIWLNTANPELDKEPPIEYLMEGHVEDIAAMVEDTLLGHPS